MNGRTLLVVVIPGSVVAAAPPELSFRAAGEGSFAFDTGVVKGCLQADAKSQGIPTLVDSQSGLELAYGSGNPGILSYYRLLSSNKRYGDTLRVEPKSARLLPDGRMEIVWPARDVQPVEVKATYCWKSPNTVDLETTAKAVQPMEGFEVFLSSYFSDSFRTLVYLQGPRHSGGAPAWLGPEVNPLVQGTYLAFPRDLRAAQLLYDGRWELGHSPVQWSITRYLAAPIGIARDEKSGINLVVMCRPEDCFAVETVYHMEPPDGVAGHRSLYMSLFGQDLKAGEAATARTRLVAGKNISNEDALKLYQTFVEETRR